MEHSTEKQTLNPIAQREQEISQLQAEILHRQQIIAKFGKKSRLAQSITIKQLERKIDKLQDELSSFYSLRRDVPVVEPPVSIGLAEPELTSRPCVPFEEVTHIVSGSEIIISTVTPVELSSESEIDEIIRLYQELGREVPNNIYSMDQESRRRLLQALRIAKKIPADLRDHVSSNSYAETQRIPLNDQPIEPTPARREPVSPRPEDDIEIPPFLRRSHFIQSDQPTPAPEVAEIIEAEEEGRAAAQAASTDLQALFASLRIPEPEPNRDDIVIPPFLRRLPVLEQAPDPDPIIRFEPEIKVSEDEPREELSADRLCEIIDDEYPKDGTLYLHRHIQDFFPEYRAQFPGLNDSVHFFRCLGQSLHATGNRNLSDKAALAFEYAFDNSEDDELVDADGTPVRGKAIDAIWWVDAAHSHVSQPMWTPARSVWLQLKEATIRETRVVIEEQIANCQALSPKAKNYKQTESALKKARKQARDLELWLEASESKLEPETAPKGRDRFNFFKRNRQGILLAAGLTVLCCLGGLTSASVVEVVAPSSAPRAEQVTPTSLATAVNVAPSVRSTATPTKTPIIVHGTHIVTNPNIVNSPIEDIKTYEKPDVLFGDKSSLNGLAQSLMAKYSFGIDDFQPNSPDEQTRYNSMVRFDQAYYKNADGHDVFVKLVEEDLRAVNDQLVFDSGNPDLFYHNGIATVQVPEQTIAALKTLK